MASGFVGYKLSRRIMDLWMSQRIDGYVRCVEMSQSGLQDGVMDQNVGLLVRKGWKSGLQGQQGCLRMGSEISSGLQREFDRIVG